jgi:hypothetical protein
MPTIQAGALANVFCPVGGSVTVTPAAQARVIVDDRDAGGAVAQIISGAQTFTTDAGGSIRIEAVGGSVTYTDAPISTTAQAASVQALASGAGNFPAAEAAANGADRSFVELLGTYISTWSNVPVSEAAMGGATYANSTNNSHCYVDAVNGNDANSGYSPAAAKKTLNVAAWTGGGITAFNPNMFLLLKRGQTHDYSSPMGGGGGMVGGRSIGSYGDPASPRPRMRPTGAGAIVSNAALMWANPDGASFCDVELDCTALDGLGQTHGVYFRCDTNASVMRNVLVSGNKIRAPRTGTGSWPGGITVQKRTVENTATAVVRAGYIRVEGNEVYGGGAHGIQMSGALGYQDAAGRWQGVDVLNNWVHDCGKDYDSHAITSTGDAVYRGTNIPWVLASGTTYYVAWNTLQGRSVGDIDMCSMVFTSRDSCTHNFTKNTATPTAPAVGEFGFDNAAQRLYVNAGAALGATEILMTSGQPPRGVLYAYNRCEGMLLQGNTTFNEGAGLQFDDYTSDSMMICNRALNNEGAGLAINFGARNKLLRNFVDGNLRCGVLTNGHGTLIGGNVIRGGSNRGGLGRGLICQDMTNGPLGDLVTQMRNNLLVATSDLDAFIYQSDTSGFRGNYTLASGNQGRGVALALTTGKVLGF